MSEIIQSPQIPKAEALLKKPVITIPKPFIETWMYAVSPKIRVRLTQEVPTLKQLSRVHWEDGQEGETLIMPSDAITVDELLQASHLLSPDTAKNPNTPFRLLASSLQNGAILLADSLKEKSTLETDELISAVYNLGQTLEARALGDEAPEGISIQEIKSRTLQYPPHITTTFEQETYKHELLKYLLYGKNLVLDPKDTPHSADTPERTVYSDLFTKWQEKQYKRRIETAKNEEEELVINRKYFYDSFEVRREFEETYLNQMTAFLLEKPAFTAQLLKASLKKERQTMQ